jgi:hypothetical protein
VLCIRSYLNRSPLGASVIPLHAVSNRHPSVSPFIVDGETYNDDRMFVVHIGRCTTVERSDTIDTTIYHDTPPIDAKWCLVTFRNTPRYPAFRVDHFETREDAQRYLEEVLPAVPLVSLGGGSPRPPKSYAEYLEWERANGLANFDPLSMFSPGGYNRTELFIQPRKASGFTTERG